MNTESPIEQLNKRWSLANAAKEAANAAENKQTEAEKALWEGLMEFYEPLRYLAVPHRNGWGMVELVRDFEHGWSHIRPFSFTLVAPSSNRRYLKLVVEQRHTLTTITRHGNTGFEIALTMTGAKAAIMDWIISAGYKPHNQNASDPE